MNVKYLAPLSLVIAACGFAITFALPDAFLVGVLRSFCEAAMVGGLADWFAVVALFRNPLRLPIPGTAIIPRNRERIEDAVVRMVKTFLPAETIIFKIDKFDIVGKFIDFYDDEAKRNWLLKLVSRTLHNVLKRVQVKDVSRILNEFLGSALKQWAPRLSKEVSEYLAANFRKADSVPHRFFALCVQALSNYVNSRAAVEPLKTALEELLDSVTLAKWMKRSGVLSVKDLSEKIISLISMQLELEERKEPNLLRQGFKQLYRDLTHQLYNPGSHTSLALDKWWDSVVNGKATLNLLEIYLAQYHANALEDLKEDDSKVQHHIELALGMLVENLKSDVESRNRASAWVNQHLASFVRNNHGNIAQIVRDTLEKDFSEKKLVSLIEDQVGEDLQYIRLNGALVGGLVGVTIHVVKTALS